MELVAVYWTLKKWFWNYRVMERANWKFIWEDYIQFNKLDSFWYPMITLGNDTNTYLKVELFEVNKEWITWQLDMLEWYRENSQFNLYNRVKTKTLNWLDVWIYEINNDINNNKEKYYTHNEWDKLFYNWTK